MDFNISHHVQVNEGAPGDQIVYDLQGHDQVGNQRVGIWSIVNTTFHMVGRQKKAWLKATDLWSDLSMCRKIFSSLPLQAPKKNDIKSPSCCKTSVEMSVMTLLKRVVKL